MSKLVNELNININRAIITSVELKLTDKGLGVDIHGSLLTKGGKKVSTFNFSTSHWQDEYEIKVPPSIHMSARKIFEILTPVVYEKIEGAFKALGSGKGKTEKSVEDLIF